MKSSEEDGVKGERGLEPQQRRQRLAQRRDDNRGTLEGNAWTRERSVESGPFSPFPPLPFWGEGSPRSSRGNLTRQQWHWRGSWGMGGPGALTSMSQTLKSASIIKSHPRRSKMPEAPKWSQHRIPSTNQPPITMGHGVDHGPQRVRAGV